MISLGNEWKSARSLQRKENQKLQKKWVGFGSDEYDLNELKKALEEDEMGSQQTTKTFKKPVSEMQVNDDVFIDLPCEETE